MNASCAIAPPPVPWPDDEPDEDDDEAPFPREIDDNWPLELDDEYWEAFLPDDDYEPMPEPGDFWTEQDAMPRRPRHRRSTAA